MTAQREKLFLRIEGFIARLGYLEDVERERIKGAVDNVTETALPERDKASFDSLEELGDQSD